MLTNRLTADDLATGFVNAKSAIAPALLDMDLVTLAASFMMIGDVLAHSGISEAQLVLFGPPKRTHGPRARPLGLQPAGWLPVSETFDDGGLAPLVARERLDPSRLCAGLEPIGFRRRHGDVVIGLLFRQPPSPSRVLLDNAAPGELSQAFSRD